jgi:hypothetical protein
MNNTKIEYVRFALMLIMIALLLWIAEYLIQNPGCRMPECELHYMNGSIGHTGLYGNCSYARQFTIQPNLTTWNLPI